MGPRPVITLTTDFGTADPYAAALKGAILSVNSAARILDLSHDIEPYNIAGAALFAQRAFGYFPSGTIHVIVVDPGVGSARKAVAVKADGQYFIYPDNGLLSLFLREHPPEAIVHITNLKVMLKPVSPSFHGRDIFAPAAAHLSRGMPLSELGEPLDDLAALELPKVDTSRQGMLTGEIIAFDRFGSAVTNITRTQLAGRNITAVTVKGARFDRLNAAFADAAPGEALCLIGSADYLEISVNQGNARRKLCLKAGDKVLVRG